MNGQGVLEQVTYDLKRLGEVARQLDRVLDELARKTALASTPEWFSLPIACRFKGVSYSTVAKEARRQPLCGREEAILNGRRVWRRATIMEWTTITDDRLEEYARTCVRMRQLEAAS